MSADPTPMSSSMTDSSPERSNSRITGEWNHWVDDTGSPVVAWLPFDDEEHEQVICVVASIRDARLLVGVLKALDAIPESSS